MLFLVVLMLDDWGNAGVESVAGLYRQPSMNLSNEMLQHVQSSRSCQRTEGDREPRVPKPKWHNACKVEFPKALIFNLWILPALPDQLMNSTHKQWAPRELWFIPNESRYFLNHIFTCSHCQHVQFRSSRCCGLGRSVFIQHFSPSLHTRTFPCSSHRPLEALGCSTWRCARGPSNATQEIRQYCPNRSQLRLTIWQWGSPGYLCNFTETEQGKDITRTANFLAKVISQS